MKKGHRSFCWDLRIHGMQLDLLKDLSVWLHQYWWQPELSHTVAHRSCWGTFSNPILLLVQETSQPGVRRPLPCSLFSEQSNQSELHGAYCCWEGRLNRQTERERETIRRMLKKAWLYKTGSISLTGRTNEFPYSRFHCALFICINNLKDRCSDH